MDKISVIIPVYNGKKFLKDTVKCVEESTYKNLEIILIDDGSTDDSALQCRLLAQQDPRVVFVSQKNRGIAAARNRGIEVSSGDWIAFCDQDDVVDPEMYALLLKKARSEQSEMAICGIGKLVNGHKEQFELYRDTAYERNDVVEQAMYAILFDGFATDDFADVKLKMGNHIWKCLIKKSLIEKNDIRFKQFINFEDDRTFLLDVLSVAQRVSLLSECLYFWRINLQSETYRRKYIYDIVDKMRRYQLYEKEILRRANIPTEICDIYFRCENCQNYVQLVDNERGMQNDRHGVEKIKYLKKVIYDDSFKNNISERKRLKKNILKKRVILCLLQYHLVIGAYLFDEIYTTIKKYALQCKIVTMLERKMS